VIGAVRRRSIGAVLAVTVVMCGVAWIGSSATAEAASPVPQIASHVYAGGGVIAFGDASPSINAPIGSALSSVMVGMAVDPASTAAQPGYWLVAADGGCSPRAARASTARSGHEDQRAHRGHGRHAERQRLLVGGAGRRGVLLRRRQLLRVDGQHPAEQAGGRHGVHHRRQGLLAVAADGGIFSFGDAKFFGSMGGSHLNAPITGMAASATGNGYWMVGRTGSVQLRRCQFYGSMGGPPSTIGGGMAASPGGLGYVMVATDGGVFAFGNAGFYGSLGGGYGGTVRGAPIAGIALSPDAAGYWLLEPDGWSYGHQSPQRGAEPDRVGHRVHRQHQVNSDPDRGQYCTRTGVRGVVLPVRHLGVGARRCPIPAYPFTGDIYNWAGPTAVLPPTSIPLPGDAVLYGTSPYSTATSVHVGLVMQVWPDGAVVTIEAMPDRPVGLVGRRHQRPYLPSQSSWYNGSRLRLRRP